MQPRWMSESIKVGCDALAGVNITQLTSGTCTSHNVYCEERYTSSDGSRIAFMRFPRGYNCGGHELWVADLISRQVAYVGLAAYPLCTSNLYDDWLYYAAPPAKAPPDYVSLGIYNLDQPDRFVENGGPQRLMRVNLRTLETQECFQFERCPPPMSCTISPDGATFVSVTRLSERRYGLYRVDLNQGTWDVFHEHDDIHNPHLQFEPGEGRQLLVQNNRGAERDARGNILRSTGEQGATLYVLDMPTGRKIPLPVGKPDTGFVTGHECWIGRTGRILLSTADSDGWRLLDVAPGETRARVLTMGYCFNHVSASTDGRFFAVDQFGEHGFGRVWIGCLATGRFLPLCESHTSRGPYCAEPFPYITPDLRHVIYNSNKTGIVQVYAAELPPRFLDALAHVVAPIG